MAKFRLQAVLEERERQEKLKQKDFAQQLQVIHQMELKIGAAQTQLQRSIDELNESKAGPGVTISQLQFHERYRDKMKYQIQMMQVQLQQECQVLEQKRQLMVEAAQKRRILEILKEKTKNEEKELHKRVEQFDMDEIAQRHALQHLSG